MRMGCHPMICRYSKTIADAVINNRAIPPRIFDHFPFVFSPITFLLFEMCSTIAVITGAVNPYNIAV